MKQYRPILFSFLLLALCLPAACAWDNPSPAPGDASSSSAGEPGESSVVAASDATANGIVKACRENGIRIPEDFSLIGFDNITEELPYIELTTVAVSHEEQMETAVELLLGMVEEGAPVGGKASVKLEPRLVERRSCKG